SPHLTDVTERFQINNQIISQKELVFYLNKIIPIIKMAGQTFLGQLTYFEILVGLAYLIFYEKKVDYAVIETGLGGKYDGTNVVFRSDKLSVLTKIGLDHTDILGKTIEEITLQKASIINKKSQAISINQDQKAEKIIKEVAEKKQSKILFIGRDLIYQTLVKHIGLFGEYQKENAGLALAAVNYLSQRDGFKLDKEKIKIVFQTAYFPGRFDIKKINKKTVIFDGAHNPQKMKAFIDSIVKKYPNKKFNFLIAFKKGKDYQEMLKIIIPQADLIVLTSFFTKDQDLINKSVDPVEIKLNAKIIPDLKKAWKYILDKKEPIVVTGSLYLIGEIYHLLKKS
ncbi:MAG: Mur ligase family protein, partial [Patescibacteria group bacterium]